MSAFPDGRAKKDGLIFVVAIDLGTTRSAVSWSIEKARSGSIERKGNQPRAVESIPNNLVSGDKAKVETILTFSSADAINGVFIESPLIDSPMAVSLPPAGGFQLPSTSPAKPLGAKFAFAGPESLRYVRSTIEAGIGLTAYHVTDFKMHLDVQAHRKLHPSSDLKLKEVMVSASPVSGVGANIQVSLFNVIRTYLAIAARIGLESIIEEAKQFRKTDSTVTIPTKNDINWVITVPAIWTDQARIFMREAAVAARLHSSVFSDRIGICLEPEGATLQCFYEMTFKSLPDLVGQSILIVDWGGGTADLTYSRITTTNTVTKQVTLAEIVAPFGGPYGGRQIFHEFENRVLAPLLGQSALNLWRLNTQARRDFYTETMLDVQKFDFSGMQEWSIRKSLLRDFFPELTDAKITQGITQINASQPVANRLRMGSGTTAKLFIPSGFVQLFFRACIDPVLALLNPIFKSATPPTYVFLVGGMGDNAFVRFELSKSIPKTSTFFSPEGRTSTAIVQGALLFGLDSSTFHLRRARTHYGVAVYNHADPSHSLWSLLLEKGSDLSQIKLNTTRIPLGPYRPLTETTSEAHFMVYEADPAPAHHTPLTPSCMLVTSTILPFDMTLPFSKREYYLTLSLSGPCISGELTRTSDGKKIPIQWASR